MAGGFSAGSIVSKLVLTKDKWDASIRKVKEDQKSLAGFASNNSADFKKMGMAMTVAGGVIVGAIGLMVKKYATAGDEVHKMALRTGFATETLSELKYAAEISGGSLTSLEKGVKKMSKSLTDASIGLETYVRSFDRIGLSVEDLMALSPEEQFLKIAEGIAALESPTLRAATAQEIFGRAGTELLPLFAEGVDGMEALRQKAKDLGYSFDQEAADGAARLVDAQTTLKTAMSGLGISISQTLAPALSELIEGLSDTVAKVSDWIKEHPKLTGLITKSILALGGLLTVLGPLTMMLPGLVKGFVLLKLSFTSMLGPIGLVTAGLAFITVESIKLINNFKSLSATIDEYSDKSGEKISWLEKTWFSLNATIDKFTNGIGVSEIALRKMREEISRLKLKEEYEKNTKALAKQGKATFEALKQTEGFSKASEFLNKLLGKQKEKTEGVTEATEKGTKAFEDHADSLKALISPYAALGGEINAVTIALSGIKIPEELPDELKSTYDGLTGIAGVIKGPLGQAIQGGKGDILGFGMTFDTTIGKIKKKTEETAKGIELDWSDCFSILSGTFNTLSDDYEGAMGQLLSASGSAFDAVGTYFDDLEEGSKATFSGIAGAVAPMCGQIGGALGKMISGAKKSFAGLGSSIGSALGGILGPVGKAVGSVLGGLIGGLFKKGKTEGEKFKELVDGLAESVSKWGEISESTAESIAKDTKEMEGFAAVSKNYADVLKDVGITQESINSQWERAIDIINHVNQGYLSAEDGANALSESFSLLLDSAIKFGTEGSTAMVNFINQVKASGLEIQGVTDYINDQLGVVESGSISAAQGLEAMAGAVGINTEALGRLEGQTLAVFNAMIANGATYSEAVNSLGGTLDAIIAKHEELGTEASAGIQELLKIREVTEANKGLFTAMEGNLAVLNALGNTGSLTQELFNDATISAIDYYNQMQDAGLNSNQTLAQMAPTLERLRYLAREQGLEIDTTTQALIRQAEEQGILGEEQLSLQDTLMAGFGSIIEAVGGKIPDAFRKAMDKMHDFADDSDDAFESVKKGVGGIQDSLDDLKAPDLTVGIGGDFSKLNKEMNKWTSNVHIPTFQSGGLVPKTGLALVHQGEYVIPKISMPSFPSMSFPEPNFQPFSTSMGSIKERTINDRGKTVMNNTINIYAQKLDDYTIHQAGEKLFHEIKFQVKRIGGEI